jgi:excisionase family DNA binding protein
MRATTAHLEKWLTLSEAATSTGLSEKTIRRAIRRGKLRRAENGVRRVLIAATELARWMKGETSQGL